MGADPARSREDRLSMPATGTYLTRQTVLVSALTAMVCWATALVATAAGLGPLMTAAVVAAIPVGVVWSWRRERRASAPDVHPFFRERRSVDVALIVAVVLGALLLRLHTLLDRPVWSDEMWTLRNLLGGTWGTILRISLDDFWPPLHYLVLGVVARVGDISVLSLRLPSVLFGVATVALMIPLGRELLGSTRLGVVAAALLAGMNTHVLYSQEARVYAMQVFFAVIAARYFYRGFWEGRVSVAYIAAATALTYSHSFSSWYFIWALMAYAVAAALIWERRDLIKPAAVTHLIIFALMLPLGAAILYVRVARDIEIPLWWATGLDPSQSLLVTSAYQLLALSVRSWVSLFLHVLLLALVALAFVKGRDPAGTLKSEEGHGATQFDRRAAVFLLSWSALPFLFSFVISVTTPLVSWGATRYHMAVLPAICLLLAAGFRWLRTKTSAALGVLLLVLLPAHQLPDYYNGFNRAALDEAAAFVKARRAPDEPIYIAQALRPFAYYYRGVYPRIGSAEWDAFAESYAHLDTIVADSTGRFASRYDVEKIPGFMRHMVPTGDPNAPRASRITYDDYIEAELARGGFVAPFWLVLQTAPLQLRILDAMESAGVTCPDETRSEFRGVLVVHCTS